MKTYSTRSTALRGAKRAGIENPTVLQDDEGRWYVAEVDGTVSDNFVTADFAKVEAAVVADLSDEIAGAIGKPVKLVSSGIVTGRIFSTDVQAAASVLAEDVAKTLADPLKIPSKEYFKKQALTYIGARLAEKIIPKQPAGEPYKVLARRAPPKSLCNSPVAYIRAYMEASPNVARKIALAHFVDVGININTARSQYERFRGK